MRIFAWTALLLVALGLGASLVPQITYPSASSGELSKGVLIALVRRPGWGIQQDLGSLGGTVGSFQFWASAEADGPEVGVHASLVDATTLEVLRQKSVIITPAYIPVVRTLTFPGYVVPQGQRLLLQLQVADFEDHYVAIYQLAVAPTSKWQSELASLKVNGVPDAAKGPLAFVHTETGTGLRAAIQGEESGRVRIALAIVFSGLSVVAHPWSVARLRRAGISARRLVGGRRARKADTSGTFGRILATPWYPWPAVAVPILHFVTNNDIHFSFSEAVVPVTVALVAVSGSVIGLRLVFKDWQRPAAVTTVVTVVFFAYGHVERALSGRADERLFFAAAVVLGAAAVAEAVRAGGYLARGTKFFNVVAAVLLVLQAANVAGGAASLHGISS